MKFTEYVQGTPCWVDLGSPDMDASKRFYADLFGWQAQANPDPQFGGYTMFEVEGDAVAGVAPLMSPEQPVAWMTYLSTDDIEATAQAIEKHGGSVIAAPMEVATQGKMGVFVDPTGAAFGVWQAGDFAGAQRANEPVSITWNELRTADPAAAAAFYSAVFGVDVQTSEMSGMEYTMLKIADDKSVAGIMAMGEAFPPGTPPHWATYFAVDDADAVGARAQELGGAQFGPAMQAEGIGRWVALADPHGANFLAMSS